jgi:oligoribonuclease
VHNEPSRKTAIIWGDIETTGLDARQDILGRYGDIILELGLRATTWDGTEIARYTSVIWTPDWRVRLERNPFVLDMHTKSGLVAALERIDDHPSFQAIHALDNVQRGARMWMEKHAALGPHNGAFPFAGNSVSFDRRFLSEFMPDLDGMFSYRILDVSSIRESMRVLNPSLFARIQEPAKAHRPQGDIDSSIELWKVIYQSYVFVDDELYADEEE